MGHLSHSLKGQTKDNDITKRHPGLMAIKTPATGLRTLTDCVRVQPKSNIAIMYNNDVT